MDKQQKSSAKRSRSPEGEEVRPVAGTAEIQMQATTQTAVPLKKRRAIRLEVQPAVTPSTTVTDPTPAVIQPDPQEQATQPAPSLSADSLLREYLKKLPAGFNLAQAVQQIQAELTSIDFDIAMVSGQAGEDDGASHPVEEGTEQEQWPVELPTTEVTQLITQADQPKEFQEHAQSREEEDTPKDQVTEDQVHTTAAIEDQPVTEVFTSAKEPDQPTAEVGPFEEQAATSSSLPEQHTPSPVQREGIVEEAQTSSDAETNAATTPERYTVPRTPTGSEFGTDDVPLAEEGIHFTFAPQEGDQPEEVPQGELFTGDSPQVQGGTDEDAPQDQGGVQFEETLPTGGEEGMGETPLEPIIVESEAENEDDVPPLITRRNRRLALAEGDGGSANLEARESTFRSSDPAAPSRGGRTITVQSPRAQPTQPIRPTQQFEEVTAEEIDEARLRKERKRKGKEIAPPEAQKKKLRRLAHPPRRGVVIREPSPGVTPASRQQTPEADTGKGGPDDYLEVVPNYSKIKIKLDERLLRAMTRFPDPKEQELAASRVTETKKLRGGKRVHLESLQYIDLETDFIQYISAIGFDWLLGINTARVPAELAKEFFTTFRLTKVTDIVSKCISFRCFNKHMHMSITEWSARLGIHSVDQAIKGDWMDRHFGAPSTHPEFDQEAAWRLITHPQVATFVPSVSNARSVQDPALRLAQVFLGYNVLGQANTSASVTLAELFFMWCMKTQKKVHLGYWLAYSCHQLATKTSRHLNICHILDALIRNGLQVQVQEGIQLTMCPKPEPFDLQFFVRVKILSQDSGTYILYTPEGAHPEDSASPVRRVVTPVQQQRRPPAKKSVKKKPETRLTVATIPESEGTGSTEGWKERVESLLHHIIAVIETQEARTALSLENTERLLTQLVEIADDQRNQMTRTADVMEQMLEEVRRGTVSGPNQPSSRRPDQGRSRQ